MPPAPLLEVRELGEGFEFVSLHDGVALARGPEQWAAVYIDPQRSSLITAFTVRFSRDFEPDVVRDVWRGEQQADDPPILALACSDRACDLFSTTEVDGLGVPMGWLTLWEPLRPEWEARGIVDLWPYDSGGYSICVYGRGMACRIGPGAWEVVRAPELGFIRAVSSRLALTDTGVLLAAAVDEDGIIKLPIEWTEVASSEPLVRLSSAGAFGMSGLWLQDTGSGFSSCTQQPALVAGTPPLDALDANGTAYSRQALGPNPAYEPCRWPGTIDGPVLGEAYITCGLARNWTLLTRDRLLAMHGSMSCVVD